MQTLTISPAALARARAVVADPGSVRCHPALIGGAWATLKAARGQRVDHARLTPAHLIEGPAGSATEPATEADAVTAAMARTAATVRTLIAQRSHLHGGAA